MTQASPSNSLNGVPLQFQHPHSSSPTDIRQMSAADPSGSSPPTKLANGNLRLPLSECRSVVIQLTLLVGNLCQLVLNRVPLDGAAALYVACPEVRRGSAALLQKLLQLSVISGLDLETCIHKKMELNRKKYPVALCKGKAGKYTEYSSSTGITKEHGQSTLHIDPVDSLPKQLFPSTTDETTDNPEGGNSVEGKFAARLPALTAAVGRFAEEREWARFHTPRNLVLALIGELGELAELWQFRGDADDEDSWTPDQHDKLGQEIADVTIYLLRLATVCQMDLHTELPNLTADGV